MFECGMKIKTTVLRALVLACVGLGMVAGAGAAPVTFAFEATVTSVNELTPADLPFSVENGDILKGQFAFEPVDADPGIGMTSTDTIQEFTFSLMLDSTVLSTSTFSLRVRDNSGADDAPDSFTDHIDLSCGSLGFSECDPGILPDSDNSITWGFLLPLTARSLVLDGADISADPNVWNEFVGFISIGLVEQDGAGVLRITASIEKLSLVPEPSSFCLVIAPFLWAFSRSFCSNNR